MTASFRDERVFGKVLEEVLVKTEEGYLWGMDLLC